MTADVRQADADARDVSADERGADADSRELTADVREADAERVTAAPTREKRPRKCGIQRPTHETPAAVRLTTASRANRSGRSPRQIGQI